MRELPPLGKDTVVRLSRQGGFAPLHALSKPREIEFGQYDSAQRGRICSVLERCLPESGEPTQVGRGDQRYFKVELRFRPQPAEQQDELTLLIPENRAPSELVRLWDKGLVE